MQQPELGQRLSALRKEKNLTQEDLVEKSHVSVRTIQRIEAGEVMPRMSTVKILVEALGQTLESFLSKPTSIMETTKVIPSANPNRTTLLTAAVAGAIYLVAEIILGAMDVIWWTYNDSWESYMNPIYIGLTFTMIVSYYLFVRGFIVLSRIFENTLLQIGSWLMIATVTAMGVMDIISLYSSNQKIMMLAYIPAAIIMGAMCIIYGIGLIRLQDGMGELSRVAGMLEIAIGCALITVVLFFISYVVMVPAVVVEILVLFKGYEYLSRSRAVEV